MQYRQGATYAAYRRAQDYYANNAAALGPYADSPAKKRLDRIVHDMETSFAQQVRSAKAAEALTEQKHELRNALRQRQMRLIVALSRAQLLDLGLKEMQAFRVPHIRAHDVTLLEAARALRRAAALKRATFVREGLPRNFLAEFDAAIDELQGTIVERDGELLHHRRHCLAVPHQIKRGREVLRILTSFVKQRFYRTRPDLVGEWMTAIRISEKPGPSRKRRGEA